MKRVVLDLIPEEIRALRENYPVGVQLYYIWCGILATRGYRIPESINMKHVEGNKYEVLVPFNAPQEIAEQFD
jgi:hypothetical protein